MPHYEARYTVQAYYYECMTLLPDPEPHHRNLTFYAKNDEDAHRIERERRAEAGKGLLGTPTICLDALVQIRDVPPFPPEPKQLPLPFQGEPL